MFRFMRATLTHAARPQVRRRNEKTRPGEERVLHRRIESPTRRRDYIFFSAEPSALPAAALPAAALPASALPAAALPAAALPVSLPAAALPPSIFGSSS